jgi:hypothetical protein
MGRGSSWLLGGPQRSCQGPSWRWPWLGVSLARPHGRTGSFRPVTQRRTRKGAGKKAQLGMAPCPQLGVLTRQLCQPAPQEPAASKGPLAPATPASKTPGKKHEVRDYTSELPTYSRRPQFFGLTRARLGVGLLAGRAAWPLAVDIARKAPRSVAKHPGGPWTHPTPLARILGALALDLEPCQFETEPPTDGFRTKVSLLARDHNVY